MTIATTEPTDVRVERPRFDGFDGLRAIAAITVLVHHGSFAAGKMYSGRGAGYFTHGDVGVAIFFLISGFLLFRPFVMRSLTNAGEPPVRGFLWRRAARIFPAYWLALTVIITVFKLEHPIQGGVFGYLRYYGLVHVYRNITEASGGISQAWTLAVEITFYCFLPLWAAGMRKLTIGSSTERKFRTHLCALAVLYAAGVAFRALCSWGGIAVLKEVGEYWLPANLDLFALGMALAVLSAGDALGLGPRSMIAWIARHAELWWLAAGVTYWIVSTRLGLPLGLSRPQGAESLAKQALHGFVALFLLLPVVFGGARQSLVSTFTRWRPLVYCGIVSYGIYLWHQAWIGKAVELQDRPIFQASLPLLVTFGLSMSLVSASISWFALERPLVRAAGRARPSHQ